MPEGEASGTLGQSAQVVQGQPPQTPGLPTADEWAKYQETSRSYAERLKGYESLHGGFKKRGFSRPEELDQWTPAFEFAKKRNLPPAAILGILSSQFGGEQPQEAQGQSPQQFDVNALKQEMLAEAKKAAALEFAQSTYRQEEEQEEALLNAWAQEQYPDDEFRRSEFLDAMLVRALKARKPFGDDHPLRGQPRPIGKNELDSLKAAYKEAMSKSKGAQASAIAQAAKGSVSTPAGANAQSAPKKDMPTGDKKKSFAGLTDAERLAHFQEWQAKKGGAA